MPHSFAVDAKKHFENLYSTYYKFAFVRNPWDRLVSWYSMIVQKGAHLSWFDLIAHKIRKKKYNQIWQYALSHSRSFEEFIDCCPGAISRYVRRAFLYNQLDYLIDEGGLCECGLYWQI